MNNDNEVIPSDAPSGAAQVRDNAKKVAGAENGARPVTDKLKAQGDAMAKKHGG